MTTGIGIIFLLQYLIPLIDKKNSNQNSCQITFFICIKLNFVLNFVLFQFHERTPVDWTLGGMKFKELCRLTSLKMTQDGLVDCTYSLRTSTRPINSGTVPSTSPELGSNRLMMKKPSSVTVYFGSVESLSRMPPAILMRELGSTSTVVL